MIPKEFNFDEYYLSTLPYFKMGNVIFINEKPFINLIAYNIKGEREEALDTQRDLANSSIAFYDYNCFTSLISKYQKFKEDAANKYLEFLYRNFHEKEVEYILSHKVFIGLGEIAVYESIGLPLRTNTTVIKNLTTKQCIYGAGIYVYIGNGMVSAWQNLESLRY